MHSPIRYVSAFLLASVLQAEAANCRRQNPTTTLATSSATESPDPGYTPPVANSTTFSQTQADAFAQCEGAENCEAVYNDDWGMWVPDFVVGMDPGSQWYTDNVLAYDPSFNMTTMEYIDTYTGPTNNTGNSENFDDMPDYESDEAGDGSSAASSDSAASHRGHKGNSKTDRVSWSWHRAKNTVHYGNIKPSTLMGRIREHCGTNGCPGKHGSKSSTSGVPYVAKVSVGSGTAMYPGTLELHMMGNFRSPQKDSTKERDHFMGVAEYGSMHGHQFQKNEKWGWTVETQCGPSGENGVVHDQWRSATYFRVGRFIRPKPSDKKRMGGYLTIHVRMYEDIADSCAEVTGALGIATGFVPTFGPFLGAFFGVLGLLGC